MGGGSENPLTPSYWLGTTDPRPLGLFRIAFGSVLVEELLLRLRDFDAFLTDDGIWNHAGNVDRAAWSLLDVATSPAAAHVVHLLGLVFALAFLTGTFTKVANVGAWVVFVSLQNRNRDLSLGGDYLISILLFWCLFVDLGAAFSVDARRRPTPPRPISAFGARLLQLTLPLIYLHAARFKVVLGGGAWLHGPAVFQTLCLDGWTRPPGALLREHSGLCALLGDGVLTMEFLIPVLLLSPFAIGRTRGAGIVLHLLVQLGILSMMKVGTFTDTMLVCSLLHVRPEWITRALERLGPRGAGALARWNAAAPVPYDATARRSVGWLAAHAALGGFFLIYAALPALWRHVPRPVARAMAYANLELKVDLYSHGYARERWEAEGTTVHGPVDLIAAVAPGIHNGVGWRFNRWTALVGNRSAETHAAETAQWMCAAYAAQTGEHVDSVTITRWSAAPQVPGKPHEIEAPTVIATERCR